MRSSLHPLAFLLGSLLLSMTWLVLRPSPPTAPSSISAFGAQKAGPRSHVERKTIELDADILRRYVGSYRLDSGLDVAIELDAGRLFAQTDGTPRYELRATAETEFYMPELDADIEFDVDAAGRVTSFAAKLPMGTITAKRAR